MVADEIVVVSRSARQTDASPVEWRGRADGSYAVRELAGDSIRPGSSVYLTAKKDAEEYFERERLVELGRRYAAMLPEPIIVASANDETPINVERPPWDIDPSDVVALADACEHSFGFRPLDCFRVEAPAGGVRGYCFIRPDRTTQWRGAQKLYAHGML